MISQRENLARKIAAPIAIWVVAAAGIGAASAQSLPDAIREGLKNPEVLEAAANRRGIDAELRRARSFYLPSIDFRGATGEEWTNAPGTRNRLRDGDDGPAVWMHRNEVGLTLRQMIFDGFSTDSTVDRQKGRVAAASERVGERSEFIAGNIAQTYIELVRDNDVLRFSVENIAAHERTLADVRARAQAGRSTVGDVRQAETRLAQARADNTDLRRRIDDNAATFARLVGAPPAALAQPVVPADALPKTAEDAVSRAKDKNPSVKLAKQDVRAAMGEIGETSSPFWPNLFVELSGSRNDNIDGVRGMSNDFMAMLVARWNLYRGGGDVANRTAAIEHVAEATQRQARFERQAEEDARRAWNAITRYGDQTNELQQRLTSAEAVLQAYRQQFEVGRRELLDLLDAQNDVFLARAALATARQARVFASYRLLAVTGELLATLGIEPPQEATRAPKNSLFN
jgi:adhesin transport system outer membrane protein